MPSETLGIILFAQKSANLNGCAIFFFCFFVCFIIVCLTCTLHMLATLVTNASMRSTYISGAINTIILVFLEQIKGFVKFFIWGDMSSAPPELRVQNPLLTYHDNRAYPSLDDTTDHGGHQMNLLVKGKLYTNLTSPNNIIQIVIRKSPGSLRIIITTCR